MKKVLLLLAIAAIVSCNEPLQVTGKTDPQATTSGTLGSAKAEKQMPALDTPANRNKVNSAKKQ